MKLEKEDRKFKGSGTDDSLTTDCGRLYLESNEMITLVNLHGKEYDVCAREWGFYATPSVNSRLVNEGFSTALVENTSGKIFVMVVDDAEREKFFRYIEKESSKVIEWLNERPLGP